MRRHSLRSQMLLPGLILAALLLFLLPPQTVAGLRGLAFSVASPLMQLCTRHPVSGGPHLLSVAVEPDAAKDVRGERTLQQLNEECDRLKAMLVHLESDNAMLRRALPGGGPDRHVSPAVCATVIASKSLWQEDLYGLDRGENQGVLYFVMEYIQGTILRDIIPERGFAFPQALDIILDICKGVVYAHGQGIVHRDLKPENIMVTQKGLIKVMDLGLAKRSESENVTKTGDTFGTPAYMSPEQITGGGQLQPATDQYALGVMFFELLTGHRPFEVADSLTLVMKHLQEPPPLVRKYKPQLPQEVEVLLDRMLAKDPGKRYPTMADVKKQIEKIQQTYVGTPGSKSGEKTPNPKPGEKTIGETGPKRDTNDLRPSRGL